MQCTCRLPSTGVERSSQWRMSHLGSEPHSILVPGGCRTTGTTAFTTFLTIYCVRQSHCLSLLTNVVCTYRLPSTAVCLSASKVQAYRSNPHGTLPRTMLGHLPANHLHSNSNRVLVIRTLINPSTLHSTMYSTMYKSDNIHIPCRLPSTAVWPQGYQKRLAQGGSRKPTVLWS